MKNIMKMCLMVAMLTIGTQAFADTTVVYARDIAGNAEQGFTAWSSDDISAEVAELKWTGGSLAIDGANGLKITGGTATLKLPATEGSTVTIDAVMDVGSSSKSNWYNISKFRYGDFEMCYYTRTPSVIINYAGNQVFTSDGKPDYQIGNNSIMTIHLVVNTLTREIEDLTLDAVDATKSNISYTGVVEGLIGKVMAAGTDFENLYYEIANASGTTTSYMHQLKVQYIPADTPMADYTVNWIDEDNDNAVVKTATRNGAVGSVIALLASDKENFFNNDNSVKYLYVSDDCDDLTIAGDGSTVVPVYVRCARKYGYQLNTACGGNPLPYTVSGEAWEDEPQTVAFPNTIENEGKYYSTTSASYIATLTYANPLKNVDYVLAEDIVCYKEWETEGSGSKAAVYYDMASLSNGAGMQQTTTGNTLVMTFSVPATGAYHVEMPYFNDDHGKDRAHGFGINLDGTNVFTTPADIANLTGGVYAADFELTAGDHQIEVVSLYQNTPNFDYLKVTAIPDVTVPVSAYGYSTFVTPCALDFTGSTIVAYVVANIDENAGIITLSPVSRVPAGEAIVVGGTTDEIPAAVGVESVTNLMTSSTDDTTADGTQYILAVIEGSEVGFAQASVGSTISAGKGFITIDSAPAAKFRLSLNDQPTSITSTKIATGDSIRYNIAGQRVNNNAKGIILSNGKVFINK